MPWSNTPLHYFFNRSAATPGNSNTPNVSSYNEISNLDKSALSASVSANLKVLIQLA